MLKIKRSRDRLIFNMGIPILVSDDRPLAKPVTTICQLDPHDQTSVKYELKYHFFYSTVHLKMLSARYQPFSLDLNTLIRSDNLSSFSIYSKFFFVFCFFHIFSLCLH